MTGTDKQIAWAEQIKTGFVAMADDFAASVAAFGDKAPAQAREAVETLRKIAAVESADWWIDNRNLVAGEITADKRAVRAVLAMVADKAITLPA